jgi:hypothetical protein
MTQACHPSKSADTARQIFGIPIPGATLYSKTMAIEELPWLVVSNFIKLIFKTLRQMLLLTSEE